MRKLAAIVLVIALVFGTMSFALAAPNDVAGTDYEDAVERLMALEIVHGYPDGTYKPGNVVTRAEFAKLMVVALGLEDAAQFAKGASSFTDVEVDYWANGYVNVAAAQGLIVGYPDGTFKPMATVSYPEALTILVRSLGYKDSELAGNWPLNFIVKASDLEVSDDVTITSDGANRGDVAILLDNTLMTEMKKTDDNEEPGTFLEEKLGFEEVEVVILGVPGADPTNSDLDDNEVVVTDNEVYETSLDMTALLGYEVKVLVKDDVMASAVAIKDNKVVTVDEDDYVGVDGTDVLTYEVDDDEKEADLSAAKFIVNTKYDVDYDCQTELADAEYFTMIDNDKDDLVDFVFVKVYQDGPFFVDEVNAEDEIIATKANGTIELDVDDLEYVITGAVDSLADIEEDDVVYIAEATDYKEIVVFRNVVEGKVSEKDGDTVVIKGKEYKEDAVAVSVGSEGEFTIGMDDVIIAFDGINTSGDIYGYITAYSQVEDDFTAGDIVGYKVKIGTVDGEKVILTMADEATIDGTEFDLDKDEPTAQVAGLVGTFVKYGVDADNNVDVIEAVTVDVNGPYAGQPNFDYNKLGLFYITDETVLFHVPAAGYEDVVEYADLDEDVTYNYDVIEVNELNEVEVVVLRDATIATASEEFVAVVDKVTTALNDDGDEVQKLYAWVDGGEESYLAKNDTVANGFAIGNLVVIEFNADDEIDAVTDAVDVTGTVYAKDSGRIKVDTEVYELADESVVYVYDSGDDDVTVGSLIDIKIDSASVTGSNVDVYLNSDNEVEVIVINK